MRRVPPAIGSMVVLTILMVSPTQALAQDASSESEGVPWYRRPGCIATRVLDAPFSAEAVTTWHPPANSGKAELHVTARYYRDRDGRVRVDFVEGMSPHRVIITLAADSPVAYLLHTAARTAIKTTRGSVRMIVGGGCADRFELPLSMNRFVGFGGRPFDEESLGDRSMAGVQVTGTRFSTMLPLARGIALGERWVSPELRLVVYIRREDSEIGVVEHQLRNIRLTEPPAHLFEVPVDYVETKGTCMMWDNPYSPSPRRGGCSDER